MSIASGFIDYAHETQKRREVEVQDRKEKEFEKLIKGDPIAVMKSGIGTRVCKIDTYYTKSYASPFVIYTGFLEKKNKQKIQIRFESHIMNDPSFGYEKINDVNGSIAWVSADGWYICEK